MNFPNSRICAARADPRRRFRRALAAASIALLVAACAARGQGAGGARQEAAQGASPTPLIATIQIDYSRRDDFLRSVTATKFTAADVIPVAARDEKPGTSIVRFEGGGVPVWQFHADEGVTRELLTQIPLIAAGRKYAVSKLRYGELPTNFLQDIPEAEPPEPLEARQLLCVRSRSRFRLDQLRRDQD